MPEEHIPSRWLKLLTWEKGLRLHMDSFLFLFCHKLKLLTWEKGLRQIFHSHLNSSIHVEAFDLGKGIKTSENLTIVFHPNFLLKLLTWEKGLRQLNLAFIFTSYGGVEAFDLGKGIKTLEMMFDPSLVVLVEAFDLGKGIKTGGIPPPVFCGSFLVEAFDLGKGIKTC